ncbi:MAG TPA: hypothetical protein VEB23_09830, partial [Ramlibacter sp.]|nr:hypothetical protein [Ramlibacter sp.]
DAYPFALSVGALEKLRYAHDVISETRTQSRRQGAEPHQGASADATPQPARAGAPDAQPQAAH